ncbi:hypothetical protein [Alteromonas alba]|nr:hypothetical protein [Alteromonas alba]
MHSFGQKLLHELGVEQCASFFCASVPMDTRLNWANSLPKIEFREDVKKLKDTSIFLILSQNCDIACRNDKLDSHVEVCVCKKIKEKEKHAGNMFVGSARKLQFSIGDDWYEANVDLILSVNKEELYATLHTHNVDILAPSEQLLQIAPLWRANRYTRTALPDNFNARLFPILDENLHRLQANAIVPTEMTASYLRAIYIRVTPMTEEESYNFALFALLRADTPDDILSSIQESVEDFAQALEEASGFTDESDIYADRDSNTFVSYLNSYLRLNLDRHSLAEGDSDIGPEL